MDWDPNIWPTGSLGSTMYYILYDLTKDQTMADIHLPVEEDDGPVLLKVSMEIYEETMRDLREMTINEGDEWMTTMLIVPAQTMRNTSDLEPMVPYILIAHISIVKADPEAFMEKLKHMKRWRPN